MINYVPHYYKNFKCIASKCRESCCIGWEIDIDDDTLEKYKHIGGDIGIKLKENTTVSEDGSICFRLTDNERCPFLNEENLCELILCGGEDMLCEICHMHPRFVNRLESRCETGIGLCCEEAARLILTDNANMKLEAWDEDDKDIIQDPTEEFLLELREKLWKRIEESSSAGSMTAMLLETENALKEWFDGENEQLIIRETDMIHSPSENMHTAITLIKKLEPLNEKWSDVCNMLSGITECEYDDYVTKEYKNLLKYYILRYFVTDTFEGYPALSMAVFAADAVTYIKKATGMSFADSACLWSKETEYSAENMEMIYEYLNYDGLSSEDSRDL